MRTLPALESPLIMELTLKNDLDIMYMKVQVKLSIVFPKNKIKKKLINK